MQKIIDFQKVFNFWTVWKINLELSNLKYCWWILYPL